MRFAHISDMHIGRRIHGFSMVNDQRHILKQITHIVKEGDVHGLLITGDVYDKRIIERVRSYVLCVLLIL
jgi:exonuclease SbcD